MLEIRGVTKTYRTKKGGETHALRGVTLAFPARGLVFLLGKSGSGKSTLLNILGGLDRPDAGELIAYGRSSAHFTEEDFDSYRNTCVGFIFQEYNLLDEFTVEENVALAAPLALPVQRVRHIVQPLERELLPQRIQLAVCHFIVMDCHGSSSRSPFLRGYPHHDHTTSARKRQADRTVFACG